mgnify:CR=1 FL=1
MQKVYLQNKFFNNWWRSIDRNVFIFLFFLIIVGGLISFAATPAVAQKYNLEPYFFVKKHLFFIPIVFFFIFFTFFFFDFEKKRFFFLFF